MNDMSLFLSVDAEIIKSIHMDSSLLTDPTLTSSGVDMDFRVIIILLWYSILSMSLICSASVCKMCVILYVRTDPMSPQVMAEDRPQTQSGWFEVN